MIHKEVPFRVLLPKRIFQEARDQDHLKMLVLEYMQCYPDYAVRKIKDGFAVCERKL